MIRTTDYLNRDAYFCGVPYGIQDADFIISTLVPHSKGAGLEEKGISAVENILFSKYLMYRTVYWHKTVRSATAMIKKAVLSGLSSNSLSPSDLYQIDDESFFRMLSARDFPCSNLGELVAGRNLHKLILEEDYEPAVHKKLLDLEARNIAEQELSKLISRASGVKTGLDEVIIDIPEPVSFEVDLQVLTKDGFKRFSDCQSVFNDSVVSGFRQSLRKVRVFVSRRIADLPLKIKDLNQFKWVN